MTCKGMNCTSTDGKNHSPECRLEYAAASSCGRFEQFDRYYAQAGGICLASVKQKHWETWKAAQESMFSALGPCVQISYLQGDK